MKHDVVVLPDTMTWKRKRSKNIKEGKINEILEIKKLKNLNVLIFF